MNIAKQRINQPLYNRYHPILKPRIRPAYRTFIATRVRRAQQPKEPFRTRLGKAWTNARVQWYTIPVGAGIAFLGATQLYKVSERERLRSEEERSSTYDGDNGDQDPGKPPKRKRIRPSGPWLVWKRHF
jgi:phosphatidylserine decarboxylase